MENVYYDVFHGPTPERLWSAHRWRQISVEASKKRPCSYEFNDPTVVWMTISDGIGHVAMTFTVHDLDWREDLDKDEIWVELEFTGRRHNGHIPERWSGVYNYRTHKGRIVNQRAQVDLSLLIGSNQQLLHQLRRAGLNSIADVAVLSPRELCLLMLGDPDDAEEHDNSNGEVEAAIDNFEAVRDALAKRFNHPAWRANTDDLFNSI